MTIGLIRYILFALKMPEGVRQELYNRLDNIAALTGTPMSPLLRRWLESNFGIELVRVIEDYSNLTPPRLNPNLAYRFGSYFPQIYDGSVIRLDLIDIFNGTGGPPPPVTFYILAENGDILNAENNFRLIQE